MNCFAVHPAGFVVGPGPSLQRTGSTPPFRPQPSASYPNISESFLVPGFWGGAGLCVPHSPKNAAAIVSLNLNNSCSKTILKIPKNIDTDASARKHASCISKESVCGWCRRRSRKASSQRILLRGLYISFLGKFESAAPRWGPLPEAKERQGLEGRSNFPKKDIFKPPSRSIIF